MKLLSKKFIPIYTNDKQNYKSNNCKYNLLHNLNHFTIVL